VYICVYICCTERASSVVVRCTRCWFLFN